MLVNFQILLRMEFLKTRLEEITRHQLEVTPLLDFLNTLSLGISQATMIRVEEFRMKWEQELYAKQLIIAYILGSWKPPSAASILFINTCY